MGGAGTLARESLWIGNLEQDRYNGGTGKGAHRAALAWTAGGGCPYVV